MRWHLNNLSIDKLASGLASAAEMRRAEKHIRLCPDCRERVETLSAVLHKKNAAAEPGEHVRQAILAEWHRIDRAINSTEKKHLKPVWKLAAGFAVVIMITAAAYITALKNIPGPDMYSPLLSALSGEAWINGSPLTVNSSISSGCILKTAENSTASVTTDGYTLSVSGSSELAIKSTGKQSGLNFNIIHGTFVSRSDGNVKYAFACGRYMVTPAGTEFLLRYVNNRLEVWVLHGGIFIGGDELRIKVSSGMKWDSDNPGELATVNPELLSYMIAEATEGNAAGKLHADKKPEAGRPGKSTDPGNHGKTGIDRSGHAEKDDADEIRKSSREMRDDIKNIRQEIKKERRGRGGN